MGLDKMDWNKRSLFYMLLGGSGVCLIVLANMVGYHSSSHRVFLLAANFHNSSVSYLNSWNVDLQILQRNESILRQKLLRMHSNQHSKDGDESEGEMRSENNVTETLRYFTLPQSNVQIENARKNLIHTKLPSNKEGNNALNVSRKLFRKHNNLRMNINNENNVTEKLHLFTLPQKKSVSSHTAEKKPSAIQRKLHKGDVEHTSDLLIKPGDNLNDGVKRRVVDVNYNSLQSSETINMRSKTNMNQDKAMLNTQTETTEKHYQTKHLKVKSDIAPSIVERDRKTIFQTPDDQQKRDLIGNRVIDAKNHGTNNAQDYTNNNKRPVVDLHNREGLNQNTLPDNGYKVYPKDVYVNSPIDIFQGAATGQRAIDILQVAANERPSIDRLQGTANKHSLSDILHVQGAANERPSIDRFPGETIERASIGRVPVQGTANEHTSIDRLQGESNEYSFQVNSTCSTRYTGVEDILCMKRPKFSPDFRNPCWYQAGQLRCLPYFHIIGVCKTGTTDLFERLSHHPQIVKNFGILGKETWYWTWKRYGHANFYATSTIKMTLDDFINMFDTEMILRKSKTRNVNSSAFHTHVTGHGDPMDFYDQTSWRDIPQNNPMASGPHVTTAHLVKHVNPDVKLILLLRDPIERLFSNYLHGQFGEDSRQFHTDVNTTLDVLRRCTHSRSMKSCLYDDQVMRSFRVPISGSFYSIHLQEWLKVFPRKQIYITRTEDFSKNVADILINVFRFLKLEPLSTRELYRIADMPHFYDTKAKAWAGEILPATRAALQEIFYPYNQELATLLKDQKYNFNPS